MPKELTEEEIEQQRLEDEEAAQAAKEAEEARLKAEAEDRGDDFKPVPDDDEKPPVVEENPAGEKKDEEEVPAGVDEIDKKIQVPKWRFDQESEKRKAIESENALLKSQLEAVQKEQAAPAPVPAAKVEEKKDAPKTYDFNDAEQRYADALVEGDKALAAQIRREIREADEAFREAKQAEQRKVESTRQQLEAEAATIATTMFTEYPFFDANSASANKNAIADLIEKRDRFYRSGVSFPEAVQKAFDWVGPLYAGLAAKPAVTKPKEEVEAAKSKKAAEEKGRAAAAAGAQPADLKGSSSVGSKKINVSDLTDEEYDNLPAAEKARLRGDNA